MDVDRWNSWKNLHIDRFSTGLVLMGTKGSKSTVGKNGIVAVCIATNVLTKGIADTLDESLKTVQQGRVHASPGANAAIAEEDQMDAVAMFGHRVGVLVTCKELATYFKDGFQLVPPHCGIVFSSFSAQTMESYRPGHQRSAPNVHDAEGQMDSHFVDLLGPYFGILQVDLATIEAQIALTPWQLDIIHKQNQNDFLIALQQ
jgi:hypothetical protein